MLNAAILALAAGVLFLESPEISLTTQAVVDYKEIKSVEADPTWEVLFGRVLSAQTEAKNPKALKPDQAPEAAKSVSSPQSLAHVGNITVEPVVSQVNANIENIISQFAAEYGVNDGVMLAIARCESDLQHNAASGPYAGLFQFLASTWSSNRRLMGMDPSPELRFDPVEAARTAAFKMARDGFGAWPACSRKALAQNI